MTGMQLSGDEPIQIESDRLEVRENENMAIFTGNVNVTQGDTVMRAGSMRVFYSGEGGASGAGAGDIERLEVGGRVCTCAPGNRSPPATMAPSTCGPRCWC